MAERYHGKLILEHSTISSYTNAVYLEEGSDLKVVNVSISYEDNHLKRKDGSVFYDYFLEMNNSTRKEEEKEVAKQFEKWDKLPPAERQNQITIFLSEYVNMTAFSVVEAEQNY